MLHDFLIHERDVILDSAKAKAAQHRGMKSTSDAVEKGWGIFYDELVALMQRDVRLTVPAQRSLHTSQAQEHGKEYLRLGYTVSEVVESYGIICQSITGLATELEFDITPREFQQLNLSLDTAVAAAVTAFETDRNSSVNRKEVKRLGYLAHELRNCIQSAMIGLELVETGAVGIKSSTGGMLRDSLSKMTDLIDTALTEVRLRSEPKTYLERTCVIDLISEVGQTARHHAQQRDQKLYIQASSEFEVDVDAQLVISALANLVQNAIKFTHKSGTVQVRAYERDGRILIEVEDECGGLNVANIEELFEPGVQRSEDRSGLGLGLAIGREAIERNHGSLTAKNLPGKGCIFTIDLPRPGKTK